MVCGVGCSYSDYNANISSNWNFTGAGQVELILAKAYDMIMRTVIQFLTLGLRVKDGVPVSAKEKGTNIQTLRKITFQRGI